MLAALKAGAVRPVMMPGRGPLFMCCDSSFLQHRNWRHPLPGPISIVHWDAGQHRHILGALADNAYLHWHTCAGYKRVGQILDTAACGADRALPEHLWIAHHHICAGCHTPELPDVPMLPRAFLQEDVDSLAQHRWHLWLPPCQVQKCSMTIHVALMHKGTYMAYKWQRRGAWRAGMSAEVMKLTAGSKVCHNSTWDLAKLEARNRPWQHEHTSAVSCNAALTASAVYLHLQP